MTYDALVLANLSRRARGRELVVGSHRLLSFESAEMRAATAVKEHATAAEPSKKRNETEEGRDATSPRQG